MRTDVAIRRATLVQEGARRYLNLEVESADLGANNVAGAHLWDARGNVADTRDLGGVQWTRKDPVDGDDLFEGRIELPPGFDPSTLGVTAWVDVGGFQIWEQRDHPVREDVPNRLVEPSVSMNSSRRARSQTPFGEVELHFGLGVSHPTPGYSGQVALERISLRPAPGQLTGVDKVDVEVTPLVTVTQEDPFFGPHQDTYPDLTETNRVTLERQPDGSFAAAAPPSKAWCVEDIDQSYGAGSWSHQVNTAQFVLRDSASGQLLGDAPPFRAPLTQ